MRDERESLDTEWPGLSYVAARHFANCTNAVGRPCTDLNPARSRQNQGHQLDASEELLLSQTEEREEVSGMHSARLLPGFPPKENDVPRTSHDQKEKTRGKTPLPCTCGRASKLVSKDNPLTLCSLLFARKKNEKRPSHLFHSVTPSLLRTCEANPVRNKQPQRAPSREKEKTSRKQKRQAALLVRRSCHITHTTQVTW